MVSTTNRIVEKKVLAASINMFVVEAPRIARKAKPGQFVYRPWTARESRRLSREAGRVGDGLEDSYRHRP